MRVLVIGGGIGGLVLGRALRDAGVDVLIAERDERPEDTGGYRLHLDSTACEILRRRLPAEVYQALLASSAGPGSFRRFTMVDHRLKPLLRIPLPAGEDNLLISRVALRTLLCHRLDVAFGREFTHATTGAGVVAHFADGTTETGDLLVGADGARSRVAAALAGRPTARQLRASGLAGRTPLSSDTVLPADLRAGPAFAFGPGGTIVFLSAHDPDTASVDPAVCREVPAVVEAPFLLWGITTLRELPFDARPDVHHELARYLLRDWAPQLQDLVGAADPGTVTAYPYYAADPDTDLMPWPAGNITALGDAVHAMPPTGGRGAITAIRDADLLATELAKETTVPLAVHTYQQRLPGYAKDALRESLQPLRWQRTLRNNPALFQAGRLLLAAGDKARATQRRVTARRTRR